MIFYFYFLIIFYYFYMIFHFICAATFNFYLCNQAVKVLNLLRNFDPEKKEKNKRELPVS